MSDMFGNGHLISWLSIDGILRDISAATQDYSSNQGRHAWMYLEGVDSSIVVNSSVSKCDDHHSRRRTASIDDN